MTDAELIEAWRDGDAQAVTRLVERWRDPLYGYLLKYTKQAEDAEDLFQDTWVKVLGALPRYEERQQFKALLFTVATRLLIDRARGGKRRPKSEALDEDEGPGLWLDAGLEACPEWRLEAKTRAALLREAIDSLSDTQRQVVLLRVEAEMSFREIAEAQGVPIGTVLPRMHRAIQGIRRYFRERGHG